MIGASHRDVANASGGRMGAEQYEQILFDRRERVGTITLNRPDRLNAWTWRMSAEIGDAIERFNDDAGIGAIVITGAGRGFCSGADIGGFNRAIEGRDRAAAGDAAAAADSDEQRARRRGIEFYQQSKPIVAAINGPAIGVGLTMTLTMDLRIASDQARFAVRFVRMGLTPEAESSLYLPQIVGIANALELSLTGRIVNADDALRFGLVSRVVPHERLMDEALALAREIAESPTDAVWNAKKLMHRNMVEQDRESVLRRENAAIVHQYSSAGHREAIRAFVEKRQPRFNE
jgi:2-(1,2-epoxy-1,2-dihydrophenyl)acetyl-CoA isomerase